MLWIYTRGAESLRIETRFDADAEEFVLISYAAAGKQPLMERFRDVAAFKRRLIALEKELKGEGWQHVGTPLLLRDGWKI